MQTTAVLAWAYGVRRGWRGSLVVSAVMAVLLLTFLSKLMWGATDWN